MLEEGSLVGERWLEMCIGELVVLVKEVVGRLMGWTVMFAK